MDVSGDFITVGSVGDVVVQAITTSTPWAIGADALAVPVGDGLGVLGIELMRRFKAFSLKDVDYSNVRPDRPTVVDVDRKLGDLTKLIFVTTHPGPLAPPDEPSAGIATQAAVLAADRAGVSVLALPLVGTGANGMERAEIAAIAIPMVDQALRSLSNPTLRRIVVVDVDRSTARLAAASWPGAGRPVPPQVARDVPVDLRGGVSGDLVDPTTALPIDRDQLGVSPYVSMLATVIADRSTPMPLSIGVFGAWGSGKSFFMALLRGRIAELAASGSPVYCQRIEQIGFNAWHYADTNLWASLGDVIFTRLARRDPTAEQQRERLRERIEKELGFRRDLESAGRDAEAEVERLQAEVDRAAADRQVRGRDLVRALRDSSALKDRIAETAAGLGITDEDQVDLLYQELEGAPGDLATLRGLPNDKAGRAALIVSGALVLASGLAIAAAPVIAAFGGGLAAVALGIGGGLLLRAGGALRKWRELGEELRDHLAGAEDVQITAAKNALQKADVHLRATQAKRDGAVERMGDLGRQLAELGPATRISAFLSGKAAFYTRHLGAVSTVRKDLENLVDMIADWQGHPDSRDEEPPIDRIVLHIDDLDRCKPAQVVQVLDAVHLLLAINLFVVVIGVDPRWLVRALCSHYADLLDEGPVTPVQAAPEDYLEKIVNIPFVLPGMPEGSLSHLLRSMLDHDGVEPEGPLSSGESWQPQLTIQPGAQIGNPTVINHASRRARPLTRHELRFLDALDPLVDTPRAAKRLFNIYRMIRATRDLSDAASFLGESEGHGEFQAVVVLLGVVTTMPRIAQAVLVAEPAGSLAGGLAHRPRHETWGTFASDLAVRGNRSTGVVGDVTPAEAELWTRLHTGLGAVTELVTLPDLTAFHTWIPRVRRFSYLAQPIR